MGIAELTEQNVLSLYIKLVYADCRAYPVTTKCLYISSLVFIAELTQPDEVPAEAVASDVFGYVSCLIISTVFIALIILDIPTYINNIKYGLRNVCGLSACILTCRRAK